MSLRTMTRWLGPALLALIVFTPASTANELNLVIPAGVGGGLDGTARALGAALVDADLLDHVRYENRSGGGGSRAYAWMIETAAGRTDTLVVASTPIVVRSVQGLFPQSWRDLTPVASVIADYGVLAVAGDSDHTSWKALVAALQQNPKAVRFGGGSVRGNLDHIVLALALQAAAVDPRRTTYVPYDGGARAVAGLLSGEVHAISSGVGESLPLLADGAIRALAVTAPERLQSLPDTPTLRELGFDVEFSNWRGLFAPPNVSTDAVIGHAQAVESLRQNTAWAEVLERNGWEDRFLGPDAFRENLILEEARISKVLKQLGFVR